MPTSALKIVKHAEADGVVLQRVFDRYLPCEELTRVLNVYLPQALLFDGATSPEQLKLIAERIRKFPRWSWSPYCPTAPPMPIKGC